MLGRQPAPPYRLATIGFSAWRGGAVAPDSDHHDNAPRFAYSARPRVIGGYMRHPREDLGRRHVAAFRLRWPARRLAAPAPARAVPPISAQDSPWAYCCAKLAFPDNARRFSYSSNDCLPSVAHFITPGKVVLLRRLHHAQPVSRPVALCLGVTAGREIGPHGRLGALPEPGRTRFRENHESL